MKCLSRIGWQSNLTDIIPINIVSKTEDMRAKMFEYQYIFNYERARVICLEIELDRDIMATNTVSKFEDTCPVDKPFSNRSPGIEN